MRAGRGADGVNAPLQAAPAKAAGEPAEKADLAGLRGQIIALVREMVESAENPVLLARASQYVVSKLGSQVLQTQWAGAGTFKRLLQTSGDLDLEITIQPEPGYIFDPRRHEPPASRELAPSAEAALLPVEAETEAEVTPEPAGDAMVEAENFPESYEGVPFEGEEEEDVSASDASEADEVEEEVSEEDETEAEYEESLPSLEEFARRVGQVTGAPDLTPRQYALVFRGIVAELREIAGGEKAYNTYQSSEAISEWCAEQGEPVGRGDVVLILKGIICQDGIRFSKRPGSYTAEELAAIERKNIKALCRRSRMELSEYEERLLDEWILGGLEEEK